MDELTLTDFEASALRSTDVNLTDGHADFDFAHPSPEDLAVALLSAWDAARTESPSEIESRFKGEFALVAGSPTLKTLHPFKICPTASLAIDIVAKVLHMRQLRTCLIEPTFDNLHLLLRRNGVQLVPLSEPALDDALANDQVDGLLDSMRFSCLFLVRPNNPTGRTFVMQEFMQLVEYCRTRSILLVIDNSFRLFNQNPFDDYAVLLDSGVSFISIEDTGKAIPTKELKASLVIASPDLIPDISLIYNELLLCTSPVISSLLTSAFQALRQIGLARALWEPVKLRRDIVRNSLPGSGFTVDRSSIGSVLPVEWLLIGPASDLDIVASLRTAGLRVLPGRHFYWDNAQSTSTHHNIRLALLKNLLSITNAAAILGSRCWTEINLAAKSPLAFRPDSAILEVRKNGTYCV